MRGHQTGGPSGTVINKGMTVVTSVQLSETQFTPQ